jgi:acetoacetyl-CoA synthetase
MTEDELVGRLLQTPAPDARATSRVGAFMDWLSTERGVEVDDHESLWRWSVTDLEGFWGAVWDYFEVEADSPPRAVIGTKGMPGTEWFPGARLNYARHIVGGRFDDDRPAVVARSQTRGPIELTYGQLTEQVARARVGLRRLGVGPGHRVVAYLPNIPETLVAFLATASLGAIWASCAAEFGERSVLDRLGQIRPKVLLAVGGYTYGDTPIDRHEQVAAIRAGLPSLEAVVEVPYGPTPLPDVVAWDDLLADHEPIEFAAVPFDHPLYVLFSSGTT